MDNYKEDQVYFPMILETSDFLWFEVPSVKKSCSSYEPYLIREMSFNEGIQEVVEKVFDVLGGHVGSYMLGYGIH